MPKKLNKYQKARRNKWRNRGKFPNFDIGEIYFKPLTPWDAAKHKTLCEVSAEHLGEYLGWAEDVSKWHMKHHIRWITTHQKIKAPYESFGAWYKDKLIGFFTFSPAQDFLGVQICYYVSSECNKRGIATLATSALVEKAFTLAQFEYAELHIDVENIASQRVAQKCGFEPVIDYSCPKSGTKGSGKMQIWVHVNPQNRSGITLDNFRNQEYSYLIPAYHSYSTALASAKAMEIVLDKIKRVQLALANKIPLSEVQDVLDEYGDLTLDSNKIS